MFSELKEVKSRKMKVCFFVLVLFVSMFAGLSTKTDYYWRNYNGDIPSDAFEAGTDRSEKPIYIGQGFFGNLGLLPGTLHAGSTILKATASGHRLSTDKFVKILCTRHPENFQWVRVNSYSDVSSLTDFHLVEGGIETNAVVHIGRVRHEGDVEIGKIYNVGEFRGVTLPTSTGSSVASDYISFDLLVYLNTDDVKKIHT